MTIEDAIKERGQKAAPVQRETQEQVELFNYLRLNHTKYPVLKWVHAIPNGLKLTVGLATKAKRSGLTKGVWDIHVPRRTGYTPESFGKIAGMYIEMKAGKGSLTKEQQEFRMDNLHDYNFCVTVDWAEAARRIFEFYGLPIPNDMK